MLKTEIPCNCGSIVIDDLRCNSCGKEMDYITSRGNRCYECIANTPVIMRNNKKLAPLSLDEAKRIIESSFTPKQ